MAVTGSDWKAGDAGRRGRRRAPLVMFAVGVVLSGSAAPTSASGGEGLTADALRRAGWTCLEQPGHLPTPCLPHADAVFSGEATASTVLTFGPDGQEFWGTEHLLHRDRYHGQRCPQDEVTGGDGGYVDLEPLNGLPYFVCHHFDSPVT